MRSGVPVAGSRVSASRPSGLAHHGQLASGHGDGAVGDGLFFPNERVAPTWTASILLSKALPHGFEASAGFYRLSRLVWLGAGDRHRGYKRVDARLAKRWRTGRSNMMLEAIVQNAGNDYETFRDRNFFERRAYLRFTIEML